MAFAPLLPHGRGHICKKKKAKYSKISVGTDVGKKTKFYLKKTKCIFMMSLNAFYLYFLIHGHLIRGLGLKVGQIFNNFGFHICLSKTKYKG